MSNISIFLLNMYKTFDAFNPQFDALARVGYFKIVTEKGTKFKRSLHNYYRLIVWFIVVTYNLQFLFRVIEVRHSAVDMVDTFFAFLSFLNSLIKQIIFNCSTGRVERLIATIKGPLFAARNKYHEDVIKANANSMLRLLKFYNYCIYACGIFWTISPLMNRTLGENVEFSVYFPFDTTQSPVFELVVVYMSSLTTFIAYGTTAMDSTIVSLFTQAKTQLQTLKFDLEHLMDPYDEMIDTVHDSLDSRFEYRSSEKFNSHLRRRFVRCIKHQHLIVWYVNEVQSIFGIALVVQFFVISWVICMTLYKIVGLSILSMEFLSMATYLVCMLVQLFIFCYYGTRLTVESDLVSQSIYDSEWISLSPGMRRQLLLMMVCSRPITPRIAYIIPMSMETFIPILKLSYTLLTMLDKM